MLDHERRHWALRWEAQAPRWTLDEAMDGVRGFRLDPDRDREALELLLEYDALATRHLLDPAFAVFPGRAQATQRLRTLWRAGFLARAKGSARPQRLSPAAPGEPAEAAWEDVWALTALGFEALRAWNSPAARALQGEWIPMPQRPAARELGARAVAVADLALGVCAHLRHAWDDADCAILPPRAARRLAQASAPPTWAAHLPLDAVAVVHGRNGRVACFLAYTQWASPDRLRRGLEAFFLSLACETWPPAFPFPPRLLWSFPRRSRYGHGKRDNPFILARAVLRERPELAQHVHLLCEEEWQAGQWQAYGAAGTEPPTALAVALQQPASRRIARPGALVEGGGQR